MEAHSVIHVVHRRIADSWGHHVIPEVNLSCVPPQPAEGEPNVENDVKLCIRMGAALCCRDSRHSR